MIIAVYMLYEFGRASVGWINAHHIYIILYISTIYARYVYLRIYILKGI